MELTTTKYFTPEKQKNSGELSDYLHHKRLIAKYSLSEPEEKIINTLDVTGVITSYSIHYTKLYD